MAKMKKMCFVTTTSATLKSFLIETAVMLHEELNMDITFICDSAPELKSLLPVYIHYIPVSMKRGIDITGVKAMTQLLMIFRREQFDIIQYSTPNAALYASLAANIAKIPIRLYAQWGIRYVCFSGVKRKVFKSIEKFTCCNSTVIRAVSQMNLDFAIKENLYSHQKGKVIGIGGTIGVDLTEYPLDKKEVWRNTIRGQLGCGDEAVFGFAGRLSKDKGGNELITAVRMLVGEGRSLSLLIVGPDESRGDINEELLQWAKKSGIVHFTGFIPKVDMPMYYSAMDVFVHPTYREGFGMVLQEAAAMELPILTTRIPGASEVMEEGVSCILAEPGDVKSLYQCMVELYQNKDKAKTMGIAARMRDEQYFDRPIMLRNQLEDYNELLGGGKKNAYHIRN